MKIQAAEDGDQYVHMNAAAHRHPAPQIGAPALTWQRGHWKPRRAIEIDEGISGISDADQDWYSNIDRVLLHLFQSLRPDLSSLRDLEVETTFSCPNFALNQGDDTITLFLFRHMANLTRDSNLVGLSPVEHSKRHDVFSIHTRHEGVNLIINAQLHPEYFTILFAVDFSHEPDISELRDEMVPIFDSFYHHHELILHRYSEYIDNPKFRKQFDSSDGVLIKSAKTALVENFRTWVDDICLCAFANNPHEHGIGLEHCGNKFAEFFGIIYGLKVVPTEDSMGGNILQLGRVRPVPHKEGHTLTIEARVKGTDFQKLSTLGLVDSVWPLITSAKKGRDLERLHGKPEYSVSLFQKGAALYVSSLGRLLPDNPQREPVVYTLIVSYSSKWRLGRLVDRLHLLGTLRLAALRDLSEIKDASTAIGDMAKKVAGMGLGAKNGLSTEKLRENFSEIGREIDVGLTYRIARSRHYVSWFRDLLDMMETVRVEGFQPYDDFVRGRIFHIFDFIDQVGVRYDGLRGQIIFQLETGRQQATQDLQGTTAKQTKVTNDLLRTAELFSVLPVTYYVGTVTSSVAPELVSRFPILGGILPTEKLPHYLFGLAVGLGLAWVSHWARHRAPKEKNRPVEQQQRD